MQFMVESFFTSMFNLFWSWVGVAVIVALVAGAVGFLFPPLRRYAAEVVVGALLYVMLATYYFNAGDTNGADRKAAEWAESAKREKADGDKIAADAARAIANKPPSERVFRDDPRNRANWPDEETDGGGAVRRVE